ncbi:MAG: 3'(2'),5'-bisphosphate nucleotidase CysQ [Beijerinckiaceae bacterium]
MSDRMQTETVQAIENLQQDLALLVSAAVSAGDAALQFFRQGEETSAAITYKDGNSPVSEADIAANDILERMLRAARPDHAWVSEETLDDETRLAARRLFVVDPIDGTRAFIAGKLEWCVSAALVIDGMPAAGVIHLPALGITYQAAFGLGAFAKGKRLVCSQQTRLKGALCAGPKSALEQLQKSVEGDLRLMPRVPSLAYRLAMAADGTVDLALASTGAHDWDIAAADIILRESGAGLVDLDHQPLVYNRVSLKRNALCAGPAALTLQAARVLGLHR